MNPRPEPQLRWGLLLARPMGGRLRRGFRLRPGTGQGRASARELTRDKAARVCPLECGAREVERSGQCIVKTCARGSILDGDGMCRAQKVKTALRPLNAHDRPTRNLHRARPEGIPGKDPTGVSCPSNRTPPDTKLARK
jgi:hypothetical protein